MRYRLTVRGTDLELRGIANTYEQVTNLSSMLSPQRDVVIVASVLTPPALAFHEEATRWREALERIREGEMEDPRQIAREALG